MLTRCFVVCIIVLAVLLGTYVGYQFYESRVESDELTAQQAPIQPNVDEGTEPSERTDLKKPLPKTDTVGLPAPKLVAGQQAYFLTPDGKKIPFRIPEGIEDSKVMKFPPGSFPELYAAFAKQGLRTEPLKLASSVSYHIDDIPEGETSGTYALKLMIAQGEGISMEAVEELIASGKLIIPSEDPVRFTEFSEYRKYLESIGTDAQTIAEIERRYRLLERRHRLLEEGAPPQIENGVFPPSVESNGEGESDQEQAVETLSDDLDTARDESTVPKAPLSPQEAIPKESPKSESDWAELLSQFGDGFAQGLDEDRLRWVAETLNRYGIEEGIRQIEAQDGPLAKRLRRNLEARDGRSSPRSLKPPPSGAQERPEKKAQ